MKKSLGDKERLQHILDAIKEIEEYVQSCDFNDFVENSMMRFASIKQLEIIGEASNNISEGIKTKFSNIEWKKIIGLRHIIVHEYFGIDDTLIWQIIQTDLPELKNQVNNILTDINKNE